MFHICCFKVLKERRKVSERRGGGEERKERNGRSPGMLGE